MKETTPTRIETFPPGIKVISQVIRSDTTNHILLYKSSHTASEEINKCPLINKCPSLICLLNDLVSTILHFTMHSPSISHISHIIHISHIPLQKS